MGNTGLGPGRHARTVYQLALSPAFERDRTLFARTDSGVYHSSDGGDTWNQAFASKHIYSLATSPAFQTDSTLFAATVAGVYRSTDGGGTWRQVFPLYFVPSLAVSPTFGTDGTLFAGTSGNENALYRSTDGGDSWKQVASFGSGYSVAFSPAFETDGTLFAFNCVCANEGVYRSTDGGDTWKKVANPGPNSVDSLALSPSFETDTIMFAYTGAGTLEKDAGLYRSTDGGDSWRRVFRPRPSGSGHLALSPAFETDSTLFADAGVSVFRSTDGGDAWNEVLENPAQITSLALSPAFETDYTLYAATHRALFRSTDGGDTWGKVNPGLSYNWATMPTLALGVGLALVLAGAILYSRNTGGLRVISWTWRVLWLGAGLEVGILLLITSLSLAGPALWFTGLNLQAMALFFLGLFILLGVGRIVAHRTSQSNPNSR